MIISSRELFSKAYNGVYNDIMAARYERWTFTGGRASAKSSFISIALISLMLKNKDYNAVIVRKYANTLRRSVFEQIVWAIHKLHAESIFSIPKSSTSALPIKLKRKGREQVIIFSGCDDPEKLKSLKCANGYFAILWSEEKTEFIESDLQNVRISALRGGDKYFIFESYNPPASARHWCNQEAKINDPRRELVYTTYKDLPSEWLGPAIMHDIEMTREHNERAYRNIYLGEATGSGELVFENIKERKIEVAEIKSFDVFYCGVDWGYYPDPYMFIIAGYRDRRLYIFGEYRLNKTNNYDAWRATCDFVDRWARDVMGESFFDYLKTLEIIADSAEPKSIADFKEYGANIKAAKKGPGSRDASFKWLQGLKEIIIDPIRTPLTADEFSLYEHDIDKKTGDVINGYPDGQPDHAIDAVRYALTKVWGARGG